jgi:hypothetical protein
MIDKMKIKRVERNDKSCYMLFLNKASGKAYVMISTFYDNEEPYNILIRSRRIRAGRLENNTLSIRDKNKYPIRYHNFIERVHPMSRYVDSLNHTQKELLSFEAAVNSNEVII